MAEERKVMGGVGRGGDGGAEVRGEGEGHLRRPLHWLRLLRPLYERACQALQPSLMTTADKDHEANGRSRNLMGG